MVMNPLLAYESGQQNAFDTADRFRTMKASRQAGNALAQGDYGAASSALYGSGMLNEGLQVQRYGQQELERQAEAERQAQSDAAKAEAEKTKAAYELAERLSTVPKGQRLAAFRGMQSFLQKAGVTPQEFAEATEEDFSDERLAWARKEAAEKLQGVNLGGGAFASFNQQTGEFRVLRQPDPSYIQRDPTKELLEVRPAVGGQSGAPRSLRNNNPGNIEDGEFARSLPGYKGTDGRFAVFETPEAGKAAQVALLGSYGSRGFNTVAKIINRWAPPADNNPTDAYVQFVSAKLGVDPNAPLDLSNPQVAEAVASAIAQFEGGGQSASNGAGPRLVAAARPKQSGSRPMTAEEKAQWGLPADGVYAMDENGKPTALRQPATDRPPTEGQINTASLAYAAFGGNERLNELAKRGIYKPQSATESLIQMDRNGVARIVARTDADRQFIQAAKEFLAPILRKDTGAAVTDTELVYYMDTYIPRFEDSPQVLWQKARARDTALRRIYGAGRKAYDAEYGPPGKWQVLTDPRGKPRQTGGGAKPQTGKAASGKVVQIEVIG